MQLLRRWWWLPPLALLVAIAWGPALVGPFQFDDRAVIVDYSFVHSLSAWMDAQPGIRPLLKLGYALNWQLSPAPFGFHLTNLLIHFACASLLFGWLRRVLPAEHCRLAPVVALIWFLHPVTTEAVTYVSGRSVSQSALFALGALYLLAGKSPQRRWWAAACVFAAMATRETSWALPLVLWLVEWLRGATARDAWKNTSPAFAVTLIFLLMFLLEPDHQQMLATSLAARDPASQFWTQIDAWRWFLLQAFLLESPNIDPDLPRQQAMTPLLIAQAVALFTVVIVSGWRVVVARSWLAGAALWFFLWLLPTNGLLPRLDVANDRHLYLPLAGAVLAVLLLFARVTHPPAFRVGAATAIVLLALATAIRNLDYSDEVSLWQRTAQLSPGKCRVWNNLGMAHQHAGNNDSAQAAFSRALQIDPDCPRAALNLYLLERMPPVSRPATWQ